MSFTKRAFTSLSLKISRVYPALELVLHKRNLIIVCVYMWERNETSLMQ